MWFDFSPKTHARARSIRQRRHAQQRGQSRRLLLEGLENRSLMAFNVLAEYATGPNPSDLALAQLNAGSQSDLVVANSTGQGSTRLGHSDGTFNSSQSTGAATHSVATGDLTGDGIADLAGISGTSVSVQKGNGDGTFQSPQSISLPPQTPPDQPGALPQSPTSIATGDLNADGTLDLVVGGQTSFSVYNRYLSCGYYSCGYIGWWTTNTDGYVNVLIGNGAGGFSAPQVQPLGRGRSPGAVAIGDINGDTKADVVAATNYQLSTLLGDGLGAVQAPVHSGYGYAPKSLSLGDVNADGRLDTITRSGNSLILHKGQANGSFLSETAGYLSHPADSAVMGDVNGDGLLDLVAAGTAFTCHYQGYYQCYDSEYDGKVSVLLGKGGGTYSLPIASALGTEFNGAFVDVALAELTGDGLPEVVTVEGTTGVAIVAKNDGEWVEPVAMTISNVSIVEGHDGTVSAVFDVTLSGASTRVVTVEYATAEPNPNEQYWYGGAAATPGVDYTASAGTLSIPVGQTSGKITVPVFGDRIGESTELFFLNLENPKFANIDYPRATGTITDDEPYVAMQYYPTPEAPEGNTGTRSMTFEVILGSASDIPVTVEYSTQDGSALAGSDYQSKSGTVTFVPGDKSELITVQVIGDTVQEWTEYFHISLTNATNASFGNTQGTGYIVDDDLPPTIAIGDASVVEGNSGTKLMTFTVSLSNPSGQWISVNYATANSTATTSNADYVATSGTLDFEPGQTQKTITVTIKGDTRKEKDERFYVNLSGAYGANIADSRGTGTIFNDDSVTAKGGPKSQAAAIDAALQELVNDRPKKRGR